MRRDMKELGRRRFVRYLAVVSGAGIAGCSGDGDGGSGDSGGDGGAQLSDALQEIQSTAESHEWVRDEPQTAIGDTSKVTWQNLGSMDGDPASATHAEHWQEITGIVAEPIVVPSEQGIAKARTKLQGKDTATDLFQTNDVGAREFGAQGFYEEVGSFITTLDSWVPGMKELGQFPIEGDPEFSDFPYREGTYLVPWFSEGWITFNNFEILEEAGVGKDFKAESFSEFKEAANQVSDVVDTPVIMPFSDPIEGYQVVKDLVIRSDGHMFKEGEPDFQNEGFVVAAEFFLSLVRDGLMPKGITSLTEGQTTTNFFNGQAGFQFNALGNLFLPGKELPIDKPGAEAASVSTYPTPDNIGYRDTPSGNLIAIVAGLSVFSERKALAADFMNFISTKEEQAEELLQEGNLPLRADVLEMDRVQEEMPYTDVIKEHLGGFGKLVIPKENQIDQVVYEEMTNAVANELTGEKVAERIQNRASQVV